MFENRRSAPRSNILPIILEYSFFASETVSHFSRCGKNPRNYNISIYRNSLQRKRCIVSKELISEPTIVFGKRHPSFRRNVLPIILEHSFFASVIVSRFSSREKNPRNYSIPILFRTKALHRSKSINFSIDDNIWKTSPTASKKRPSTKRSINVLFSPNSFETRSRPKEPEE